MQPLAAGSCGSLPALPMRCAATLQLLLLSVLLSLALLALRLQQEPPPAPREPPAPQEPPAAPVAFAWRESPEPNSTTRAPRHPLRPPYPYPYRFLLNEPHKCAERPPFLVLLVASRPQDTAARLAVRRTWGAEGAAGGARVVRLFLTGVHPVFGAPLQRLLREESARYGDLLQQDFLDTYNNLTLKTLMGLEWVSRYCPGAAYVLKADQDVFLNPAYLVRRLLRPPKRRFVTGHVYRGTAPLRGKRHKWYVPREVFAEATYPPYCGGPAYVLSGDVARGVFAAAQRVPLINMEDAFVGLCLRALGVRPAPPPPGLFHMQRVAFERCRFARLVMVHHYEGDELLSAWERMKGAEEECPP